MMTRKGAKSGPDPRRSYAWQKLRTERIAIGRANNEPCCRCTLPIDYTLKGTHRFGPQVDHLRPIGVGGDALPPLEDLGVGHAQCNARHGTELGNRLRAARSGSQGSQVKRPRSQKVPTALADPQPRMVLVPVDWSHLTGTVDVDRMPSDAAAPRLFSPRHPDAVGTFADRLLPWIDERMSEEGAALRWWQRVVLERLWEHDGEGRLVWRTMVLSTPRQVGKSLWAREHALARCANPELFGEPQTLIHTSRTLTNSTALHSTAWSWAGARELSLLRRFGSERIGFADGGRWMVSSLEAIYGFAGSVVTVDEAWDVPPKVVTAGALPVLASRNSAQLHLLSTANRAATELVPQYRVAAARPGSNVMLAEWSAPADADPLDLESYRLASPFWDHNRAELIGSLMGGEDAPSQFLNQWPGGDGVQTRTSWPPGWVACPKVTGRPPSGGVAAIEVDLERRSTGVAVAVADGTKVRLWTTVVRDVDAAMRQVQAWSPWLLLAGASIHDRVAQHPGGWELRRAGTTETRLASPVLLAAVRDKRLSHTHHGPTDAQVQVAVALPTESGPMLSGKRSAGPIPAVKAAAWAVAAALESPAPEVAAIF